MGGARAAESGHITPALVVVPTLAKSSSLNVAVGSLILTPQVHCVVLGVLR